jgi:hypothetical protein
MQLAPEPRLSFDVPNGRLTLSAVDLDLWAEHLAWCYGFMGVPHGATIAAQDFGSSPISFLGSRLLMPGLQAGVAERMDGRFICLDASAERVTLTSAVLAQLPVDALVVRADIVGLLEGEIARKSVGGFPSGQRLIVSMDENDVPVRDRAVWRHLLNVPASMLLAPECSTCGGFHLRPDFYEVRTNGEIRNLLMPEASPCSLPAAQIVASGECSVAPEDDCIVYFGTAGS